MALPLLLLPYLQAEVVDACLASGHLPFLLDGRLSASVKGAHAGVTGQALLPAMPALVSWLPGRLCQPGPIDQAQRLAHQYWQPSRACITRPLPALLALFHPQA